MQNLEKLTAAWLHRLKITEYHDLNIGEGFDGFERYDRVRAVIENNGGVLSEMQAVELLVEAGVVHGNENRLQWTVIYKLTTLEGVIFANRNIDNLLRAKSMSAPRPCYVSYKSVLPG